jgi:serine/threonine protein phosphatase PrpC
MSIKMGACASSVEFQAFDHSKSYPDFEYPNEVILKVKQHDPVHMYRKRIARFSLTTPKLVRYTNLVLNQSRLGVSMCILPGQDPFKEVAKVCQDGLFVIESNGSLFAGLFDGHGENGEEVVEFCIKYLQQYFKDHRGDFDANPTESIEQAVESCDLAIARCVTMDSLMAGTTAVILYINANGIHVGSVGDSRAVLGTSTGLSEGPERSMSNVRPPTRLTYKRQIDDITRIAAIPLTTDQKPNHEGELDRILEAGGKVARLLDENGKRVGPYRVWNAEGRLPGLAMSRSLGDRVAHSVGVSSEPIVESFNFEPSDQFIVIASDGVWDVLENKDAINLIERFRNKSKRGDLGTLPKRLKPVDVHIAHLVALEARYRWFQVVQEEDVMIDDISVIVIELESMPATSLPSTSLPHRMSLTKQSVVVLDESQHDVVPSGRTSDHVRGSLAVMPPPNRQSVSRKDKVRGSVVLNEDARAYMGESVQAIKPPK